MKTKDYLIVALAPFALLWIPFVGVMTSSEWKWSPSDFLLFWFVLAGAAYVYRLLATRRWANLAYRLGAGLAVVTGFLLTWVSLAVQIIGDENPGNVFYLGVILLGLIGVGVSRFQPAALAKVALTMAASLFVIPLVSVMFWPADFSPGFEKILVLNGFFVAMFAAAGLFFRHAAKQTSARPVAA